jgi:hypothetical protein
MSDRVGAAASGPERSGGKTSPSSAARESESSAQRERDRIGGLDDLFAMVEEPVVEELEEIEEKPRSRAAWAIRNLLLVAVATVVTVAALRSAGFGISLLVVVAAFVALRLLMLAVSEVAPPPAPTPSTRRNKADDEGLYHWAGSDSLRAAVRRWERRLEWAQSDPATFSRNVLPVLAELTDERLRLRHGITRASDPRRARELLGEPLWLMLGDAGRRPPRARDLANYVEALERL